MPLNKTVREIIKLSIHNINGKREIVYSNHQFQKNIWHFLLDWEKIFTKLINFTLTSEKCFGIRMYYAAVRTRLSLKKN